MSEKSKWTIATHTDVVFKYVKKSRDYTVESFLTYKKCSNLQHVDKWRTWFLWYTFPESELNSFKPLQKRRKKKDYLVKRIKLGVPPLFLHRLFVFTAPTGFLGQLKFSYISLPPSFYGRVGAWLQPMLGSKLQIYLLLWRYENYFDWMKAVKYRWLP